MPARSVFIASFLIAIGTADSLFGSHHLDHAPDESTHLAQEMNSHLLRYREERDLR
jgi:hypothetical protein